MAATAKHATFEDEKCKVQGEEALELATDTPSRVVLLLQQVVEPNKQLLIAEVKSIAGNVTRSSKLKGFRLQERGSLFSPLIDHISDADIQLFTKKRIVTVDQCEQLLNFARSNFYLGNIEAVRWEGFDGSKIEVPFNEFDFASSLQGQAGYSAFILVGVHRFSSGILVPVDLALSCDGQKSEPAQQRCEKILTKLQEGDFAKVLQKVRALFKKGYARDRLVDSVNSHVGALRFVVKQLGMIQRVLAVSQQQAAERGDSSALAEQEAAMTTYLHAVLGFAPGVLSVHDLLPASEAPALLECECELQRRALAVIQTHHDAIAQKLVRVSGGGGIDEYLYFDEVKYMRMH
jgi:hypothetical protein